jgi:hypothetical protein
VCVCGAVLAAGDGCIAVQVWGALGVTSGLDLASMLSFLIRGEIRQFPYFFPMSHTFAHAPQYTLVLMLSLHLTACKTRALHNTC